MRRASGPEACLRQGYPRRRGKGGRDRVVRRKRKDLRLGFGIYKVIIILYCSIDVFIMFYSIGSSALIPLIRIVYG